MSDLQLSAGLRVPVLQTERLTLTALTAEHLDDFAAIQYDPRVAEWFGGLPDPPHPPAQQREETWRVVAMFLGHWALRGHGQWALIRRSDGRLVGRAGLWSPEGWPGVEVGWLVDPELWGQGYASEAGAAALRWGMEDLGLDEVISVTVPHNVRSRRVMARIGLTDTGRVLPLRGHEQVLYRITREEWHAHA